MLPRCNVVRVESRTRTTSILGIQLYETSDVLYVYLKFWITQCFFCASVHNFSNLPLDYFLIQCYNLLGRGSRPFLLCRFATSFYQMPVNHVLSFFATLSWDKSATRRRTQALWKRFISIFRNDVWGHIAKKPYSRKCRISAQLLAKAFQSAKKRHF